LTETTAAVDRYLIAFERGTLDDDAPEIQARLSALNQSKALRAGKPNSRPTSPRSAQKSGTSS
jgi:hypothetical protein